MVIHVDGVRLVRAMPTGADLRALRALPAADRAGSPLLTDACIAERFRVYACACACFVTRDEAQRQAARELGLPAP